MIFLIDYILSILAIGFSIIFLILPVRAGLFVGRAVGAFGYYVNRKRRRIAYANMKAAFRGEKSPEEFDRIIRNMYMNFGQVLLEVLTLPRVTKTYLKRYIEIKNPERLDEALAQKHGVIFLTAHFGDWELVSIVSALSGYPLSVLAREQKMKRLNGLLNFYRSLKGCKVVKKGMATREIFKSLKENGLIGVLSDQNAGRRGTFVPFFGRPTSFAAGVVNLAADTGARILPSFIVRTKGPHHTIFIEKPLEIAKSADRAEDEKENVKRYADILESYIRKFPDQWLWVHKRWKSTPQKTIIILSDGKQGHLNQSACIRDTLVTLRRERGYREADTKSEVLDIRFRSAIRKNIYIALTYLPFVKTSRALVRFALEDSSYRKLVSTYGDIIISAGASLVPINIFAKFDNNARSIAVMDPGPMRRKYFDLCIVPRHDMVKLSGNMVITKGSPHCITRERLLADARRLSEKISPGAPFYIGLIVGGSNENFHLTGAVAERLLIEVVALAQSLNAGILVTTSRRTSPEVERMLKETLAGDKNCKLLIIANEHNFDFALSGILGLSELLIVSGDSTSMVSEAASAGKRVLVFEPQATRKNNKHRTMLKSLDAEGYITLLSVDKIKDTALELIRDEIPLKALDDREVIVKAVERFV